jgi:hypothetical protein
MKFFSIFKSKLQDLDGMFVVEASPETRGDGTIAGEGSWDCFDAD